MPAPGGAAGHRLIAARRGMEAVPVAEGFALLAASLPASHSLSR